MENARSYTFASARDVHRHLNRWAAETLTGPAEWAAVLGDCVQWIDYSPRNAVLLASYGARGPVAGQDTWRLVEGTDGRPCTPRAGERGYPVRIPVTSAAEEPDPFLGGTRPVRAHTDRFEWYPVFSAAQLARPPAPDTLPGVPFPARVSDGDGSELAGAVRSAARTLGHPVLDPGSRGRRGVRIPTDATPDEVSTRVLVALAGRGAGTGRQPLTSAEAAQVAWLVTDRVHRARGSMPAEFDPSLTEPRDRWARLIETVGATRNLVGRVGTALGCDLLASPLPRRTPGDDRVVRPTVKAHLPEASVRALSPYKWVHVGPYSAAEWAARGLAGAHGRAAYLLVSPATYLVAFEQGTGARWQLESLRARAVNLAGDAPNLPAAQTVAVSAAVAARLLPDPPIIRIEWHEQHRERDGRPFDRAVTDEGVTLLAMPGAGGRWQPVVLPPLGTPPQLLPLTADRHSARDAAERAGERFEAPARTDDAVRALVTGDDYHRQRLVALVGNRLDPPERTELADPALSTARLADLLAGAGVSAVVVAQTLRAEQRPVNEVAHVLPTLGIPTVSAVQFLADGWEVPVVTAGQLLGATVDQLRDAGATPAELLAAHPDEMLRRLEPVPDQWRVAAHDFLSSGATSGQVTSYLVHHAPTPECFVLGMDAVAAPGQFLTAVALAASCEAPAGGLAGLAEWHGADLAETANALRAYAVPTPVAVETLRLRCEGDRDAAVEAATTHLGLTPAAAIRAMDRAAAHAPTVSLPDRREPPRHRDADADRTSPPDRTSGRSLTR